MTTADLTSTPWRPALAIAANSGGIVASTTAHGEATIMKVIARSSEVCSASPHSSGAANSMIVAATMPIRVALLDLFDEQLRAHFGLAGFGHQCGDAGHDGVLGAAVHPRPQ